MLKRHRIRFKNRQLWATSFIFRFRKFMRRAASQWLDRMKKG